MDVVSGVIQSYACLRCNRLHEPESDLDNRLMGIIIFACPGCGNRIQVIHTLCDQLQSVEEGDEEVEGEE